MKVTLITMEFDGDFAENVGLGRIKAFLNNLGYLVDIVYFRFGDPVENIISRLDLKSVLFGISVYDKSIMIAADLAKTIKEECEDSIIVVGSKYATIYYKEILRDRRLEAIDYVILGDGEYTFSDICECLVHRKDLGQLVQRHPHLASRGFIDDKKPCALDVSELPFPDRSMVIEKKVIHAYICDSHGCCNRCSFCAQGSYYTKWNGRSAESLYKEIKMLYQNTDVIFFDFTGGSFEDPGRLGKDRINKLCDYILGDGLKITLKCYLRANSFQNNFEDMALLQKMYKAGFKVVFVGIESGNKQDLEIYNKNTTVEQNKEMLKRLTEIGIYCGSFGFIMLNPYSTDKTIKENYEFLSEINCHNFLAYTGRLIAYSGTAITKRIISDGLMLESDDILHGVRYKYLDSSISEIDRFLVSHFYLDKKVQKLMTNTDAIPLFIHQLYDFLPNGFEFLNDLNTTMDQYASLFKEYFGNLYETTNLSLCQKEYDAFIRDISELDKRLTFLKNKFLREMILIQRKGDKR